MTTFELSAHMTVRPGRLEGFKKQAAEIIRLTKEKDTQTLRYDWFITDDGAECEVRELYASAQGLIEHKAHIGAALHELFEQYADNHFMTIYGEPAQQLVDRVKTLHMEKQIRWFSFVKGLESPSHRMMRLSPQDIEAVCAGAHQADAGGTHEERSTGFAGADSIAAGDEMP